MNLYAYVGNDPVNMVDPDGTTAKAFKMAYNVVRKASRNGWDFKKAGVDEIAGFVDNAATLADGRFTSDDIFAAIDIVTGFGKEAKNFLGKQNRNQRLKDLVDDPKVSSADRGWIKQEMNEVAQGKKGHLRNPPGKDLAHQRGRENAKGYGYEHSDLQNRKDHQTQHKLDDWGRKNKERGF